VSLTSLASVGKGKAAAGYDTNCYGGQRGCRKLVLTIYPWHSDQFLTLSLNSPHVIAILSNAQLNGINVILKITKVKMDMASLKVSFLLLSV